MSRQIAPVKPLSAASTVKEQLKAYGKVESKLRSLVLDLREVARLLVSLEPVRKGCRIGGGDETSQKANQSEYCPHPGACRRTMRL
jgi:poly(A) polymerase Pap1